MRVPVLVLVLVATASAGATPAFAQGEEEAGAPEVVAEPAAPLSELDQALDDVLGDLEWGASEEEVLADERERILDAYRLSIAGETDPLVIDRQRREADEDFEEIRDARVAFDGVRTGFEVSVLRGEVVAGQGQSMIPVRDELVQRYYVFENGALKRVVVTYDQADLGYIHFEPFTEQLLPLFGAPTSTESVTDDIGREMLTGVSWVGDVTRLRVEDRTEMFASYILVYDDATWTAPDPPAAATGSRESSGRGSLGNLMQRLESDESTTSSNDDVVDDLLGAPTTVELRIRVDEDAIEGSGEGADPEEDAAEAPAQAPRRSTTPSREEEEDDGGEIVY